MPRSRHFAPITIRHRGYLPHWEFPGSAYAVTFRLADSLPASVLAAYAFERDNILATAAQMNRPLTPAEESRLEELFSQHIQEALDRGVGACHLRDPAIAQLVFDAIRHFHAVRYQLYAWCIMPNHVHAVLRPLPNHALDDILHSWKSYTAHHANALLSLRGRFWMPEYYDHLIRDQSDFHHACQYALNNPAKCNLSNWPWVASLLSPQNTWQ